MSDRIVLLFAILPIGGQEFPCIHNIPWPRTAAEGLSQPSQADDSSDRAMLDCFWLSSLQLPINGFLVSYVACSYEYDKSLPPIAAREFAHRALRAIRLPQHPLAVRCMEKGYL